MTQNTFLRYKLVGLFLMLVLVNSCAGTSASSRFYVLSPIAEIEGTKHVLPMKQELAIGVGPIIIPEYMNRPQIVTRSSQNELKIHDFQRWAGSFKEDIVRVLAANLETLLATEKVVNYPWTEAFPLDYQVEGQVTHFEGIPGDDVVLKASWAIFEKEGEEPLVIRSRSYTEPTQGGGYNAYVAAQSRLLARLSRDVAMDIKDLSEK